SHDQPRGGGPRHRRGAAGNRARPRRRDPGGGDLQRVRALDRQLPRAARRRLGAGDAPRQPRSRPPRAAAGAGRGVAAEDMTMRLGRTDEHIEEAHEINVTPFIDVMLVLLIIFMVAAPLATVDVAVDLPASTAEPQPR